MATGLTTTGALADSLPVVLDSARIKREYEGTFMRTCENHTLEEGTGLDWNEIALDKLTAQAITETTVLDDAQQLSDTLFSVRPTVIGIQTIITDKVMQRITKKTVAKMGGLAANAMQRKKDQDYLTLIDGFTTSLSGSGTTLQSGVIDAAAVRIKGNTTEPSSGSTIFTVLHSFQVKDIQDEIKAGVGTYTVPTGITEDVFRRGFEGSIGGTNLFRDDNITINSNDAKGGVHAREAVVLVQGHGLKHETRRRPEIGGGADELFMYDEYGFGERSAGNWGYEILSDASVPTS